MSQTIPLSDGGSSSQIVQKSSSQSMGTAQVEMKAFAEFLSEVISSRKVGTSGSEEISAVDEQIAPSIERLYPHFFDGNEAPGKARVFIVNALSDARLALESFGANDFEDVATRLSLIASTMSRAHPLTAFNESLGSVVSYIRRATITMNAGEITRAGLNVLVFVLSELTRNPAIDLEEAVDLVDKLSTEGWQGDHAVVQAMIAALFDDNELPAEEQKWLFESFEHAPLED